MKINTIHIKNFRSILDETLILEDLTALLGPNGSGKSSFLQAIKLFYSTSPIIEEEDFYNKEVEKDIIISIKFFELSEEATKLFYKYIENNSLTIDRVLSWNNGKPIVKFHGSTLQNPEFDEIKNSFEIRDRGSTAREKYNFVRSKNLYDSLPAWTTIENVKNYLKEWEETNPDKCRRIRDDGQFFGFNTVAQGYLGKFTQFLFIPAVREASEDAVEGKGSILASLMELVVKSVIANKENYKKFQEETQNKYNELMDPEKLIELKNLEKELTRTLKTFVPNTEVSLNWQASEKLYIPFPKADIKLIEDNYSTSVERTGHGLQRAFILTMLQQLTLAQRISNEQSLHEENSIEKDFINTTISNLVLAIEEPEIYQHPCRQIYFSKILQKLAEGIIPGVAKKTQIIYTTHSPLFVRIDNLEQIRTLKKIDNLDKPKVTKIIMVNLDKIAEIIWIANGKPIGTFNATTLKPRLKTIMTREVNEGFFANKVVLVEGAEDKAVILGFAEWLGYDFDSLGITVIQCNGKTNIDRPAAIFRELKIPTYIIWDGDKEKKDSKSDDNKRLLRLLNEDDIDWPNCVEIEYACFENNISDSLKQELGEDDYNIILNRCKEEFCMNENRDALKNPIIIQRLIQLSKEKNLQSRTLEKIIENIINLKI